MSQVKAKSAATQKRKAAAKIEHLTMVTPEERYHMIAEAAYYRAEKRGFAEGDTASDWLEAEAEIDRILHRHPAAPGTLMSAKEAFQDKLEAQLKEWDARLDELRAKAHEARDELRADYEKQLAALIEKRDAARTRAHELRMRTEDAWEDLKGGTEKAWDEMRKALDKVAARFK